MRREILPVFVVFTGLALPAQDVPVSIEPRLRSLAPPAQIARVPSANFRVDSNLILIPVNVVDSQDRQVLGLAKEQFRVYDDEAPQSITHFVTEDAPISVAIVFDASASMGPRLKRSRDAVAEILSDTNPEDEFALIQFNSRVERLVDLTGRTENILSRISLIQSKGQTALLDAIYFAVDTMKRARNARKAIILISDGGDNCSRYSLLETKQMVREADVQIFAIGIFDPAARRVLNRDEVDGPALLGSLADETGGRLYFAEKPDEIRDAAGRIGMTLRHEYLLGYSPTRAANDGKYHRITVELDGARSMRLFWRVGYFAPAAW
jgi:VWFA-related protein